LLNTAKTATPHMLVHSSAGNEPDAVIAAFTAVSRRDRLFMFATRADFRTAWSGELTAQ
jgi:hypothetical protein